MSVEGAPRRLLAVPGASSAFLFARVASANKDSTEYLPLIRIRIRIRTRTYEYLSTIVAMAYADDTRSANEPKLRVRV